MHLVVKINEVNDKLLKIGSGFGIDNQSAEKKMKYGYVTQYMLK